QHRNADVVGVAVARTDRGRSTMSRMRGGLVACFGALAVACFIVIGAGAASSSHARAKSKFTKQDRQALARQVARGERTTSLLIATPRHGTGAVVQQLRSLGG